MIDRIEAPVENLGGTGDGERRGAAEAVERELVMMFRRARNFSMTVAAQVHPDLDPAS